MYLEIKELQNKIFTNVENLENEELIFTCEDGSKYKMYHQQDCCEDVRIDDINGDLNDLINTPILLAEERSNEGESEWGTSTWTFYTFRTQKGDVDIKWFGESNGYYSESVDIIKI